MRTWAPGVIFAGVLMLAGCARSVDTGDAGETVALKLKDGRSFTGAVRKRDNSSITLRAANGETRTFDMSKVDSEKYVEPPSAAPPRPAVVTTATETPLQTPVSAVPNKPTPPDAAAAAEEIRTIPAGTALLVRNAYAISVNREVAGQAFPAVITEDVPGADGKVALPKGANATLVVRAPREGDEQKDEGGLTLVLTMIEAYGSHYNLGGLNLEAAGVAEPDKASANPSGGDAAPTIVTGAVGSAGQAPAIGSLTFAAKDTGPVVTRGKSVRVPAGTVLSFRLKGKVQIRPAY